MKNALSQKIKKEDIVCPRCNAKNTWREDNPARPFCSPRCKLIDLGAWADESHRIPGDNAPLPDASDDEPG
ncbi:MAG TPA: DNA gyrase inhibitor YacG [Gammaproteobacteria bacterium]|nr:DNA gyrase inhibitor YacG [Gammaproteobacteria bacterium]